MNRSLTSKILRVATYPFTGMPGKSFAGPLPALTVAQSASQARLEAHVRMLAETIGERHIGRYDALQRSVEYISSVFESAGYFPKLHTFPLLGKKLHNVEATLPGRSNRILVVGSHYDSIPGSPGADDNASAVAVLMEVAFLLKDLLPNDTIRFVAFANEEHPSLPDETMGSYIYARDCKKRNEVVRMMVLEMLGFFKDHENSQHYPFPFNLVYPTTGNFLGFVGNWSSRSLVHQSISAFRKHGQFPSDGVAAPDRFKDIGRSDHWGFWQFGYPAIMITDTANFRNPHYHTELDTPDTLNYEAMSRVASGLAPMIQDVAGK